MIEGHGNNIHDFNRAIKEDFSSNVFNHPKTDEIVTFIQENANEIKNYPDSNCTNLRNKISARNKLSKESILICNGSTEAFYLIAHAFKKSNSVIPTPSFSEYEDACKLFEHTLEFPANHSNLKSLALENKIVWLGNPNNPDGKYIIKKDLIELIQANAKTLFIIDEAYIALCAEAISLYTEVKNFENLIVIKSFTKLFAIPGIRLGYIIAPAKIISKLRKHQMPWAVNALALKAGEFIIDKLDNKNDKYAEGMLKTSKILQQELSKLEGFKIIPSNTNYFLAKVKGKSIKELQNYLMERHGFLIRNAENFRGLGSSWMRIASQGKTPDNQLLTAIKKWHTK